MKLSSPKKVFDLDNFLPPDGENSYDMSFSRGDLTLDIYYESDDSKGEQKKRVRFVKARHFFKSPFPGISFFDCPDDRDLSLLNSIVEYENSELLDKDSEFPGSSNYKHYRVFLHSVGAAIYVVAKSIEVSD